MHNIWRVLSLIPEYRKRTAWVLFTSTMLSLLALAFPYLLKLIIDAIVAVTTHTTTAAEATRNLEVLLGCLVVVRILVVFFDFLQSRLTDLLWVQMGATLRTAVYRRLESLSIDYFERNKVGEIMQRTQNGVMEVSRWVYGLTQGVLSSLIQSLIIVSVLLVKSPLIGLVLLVIGPLNIWNSVSKTIQTKPIRREWLKSMERAMGKLNESIGLATSVRSLSAEPTQRQAFDGKIAEWLTGRTQEYRVQWRSNIYRGTINSVGLILPVIIVCYGAVKGQYTAGDVYLILSFTQIYLSSLSPISRLISDTGDVDTAAERIMEILDEQPTVVDSPNAVVLESIETLEFQNVSFLYPGTKRPILDDISFKLNERKTIALVGPSGAGKSTIIKLILRFYEPSSGQILINDQPIETFTQASVRLHLGVVMQDVALFNDTAAENLRLARPNATMKELQTAASIAHADIFIEKLPDKYKSIVGERGIKLSGGEKQRMAIARAILRDPDLIILDEATSALDSESERFVQEGLQRLMEGKAALVIAHRLSTIRRADMILVLKDGQIVERGDHTKLANKKSGLYARLYELQTAGAIS